MSKAIECLGVDIGGMVPHSEELITVETLGCLKGLNINERLGSNSEDITLMKEYESFLKDIRNAPIVITNGGIGLGEDNDYFGAIDFSTNITFESTGLIIDENYYVSNKLWANSISGNVNISPSSIIHAENIHKYKKTKVKLCGIDTNYITVGTHFEHKRLREIPSLCMSK